MIARTESLVACSTETPVAATIAAPLAESPGLPGWALAWIFSPSAFSSAPQLPSSAETISPLSGTGQLGLAQDAPSAFFFTRASSSPSSLKNCCHSGSTEFGSRA